MKKCLVLFLPQTYFLSNYYNMMCFLCSLLGILHLRKKKQKKKKKKVERIPWTEFQISSIWALITQVIPLSP